MSFQKRVRELAPELRMAGIAAIVLVLSLFLPWYQKSFVPTGKSAFVQDSLSAFGVFTLRRGRGAAGRPPASCS